MASPMGEGLRGRSSGLKPIETKRKVGIEEYDMVTVEDEPLSPMARLFHDRRFDVHAVAFMACKTRISPQPVKEKLVHTLLKHPRFTSLMVVDEENLTDMKWVQTKIDLDQHIVIVEVDETQLESPDKFVEDYIYNLSKTSLDRSKPLWDLHIINVKTRQAESVVVFRVHHSLGDGTSLISLLLACTRQTADDLKLPTIPTKKRRPTPSGYSAKEGLWRLLGKFWLFIVMFVNTAVDVFMFIITIMFLKDTKTPISAPPDFESNKARRIVHRIISLDDLKFVKNAMNVTINDVALGLTQAGLSQYLNRRYAIGGKDKGATERSNNLPNGIRLRSCLCFNLRSSAGIEVATEVTCKGFSNSTICFTNLVGPQEEIGFCGYPITYFAPSAYGQPSALMINFQSYINKMIIVVSVDENAIPDPHQLLDDFEDSLNLIKNAIIEKGLIKNLK
ncbi:hypothetical protein AABB24_036863 [Solanum stoloniferum]|uniref:Diacylglycerol O-acyltransferase n=1 Tax=Solanum stoloniferum TaxID=62892 RepID=A0ABD2R200_9SOLN